MSDLITKSALANLQQEVNRQLETPSNADVERVKELIELLKAAGHVPHVNRVIALQGTAPVACSAGQQQPDWGVDYTGWVFSINDSNSFRVKTLKEVIHFMEVYTRQ